VLELGAWRDEDRRFAVGLNGKVSKHDKERQNGSRPRQGASASPAPPASGAAAHSEPTGADRIEALTERYLGFKPEILLYYPSANFREIDHGLWITARFHPLGLQRPCYWVCLFLPSDARLSPKAFAFNRLSPMARAVGPRHTNFPDGSICAFTDGDDAWRPGDSPKILLNLYAEWLVCQLFYKIAKRWPGKQVGLDAVYRQQEFDVREWCDCGSDRRYGNCHFPLDVKEVERLKFLGGYEPLAKRFVPETIMRFAKSRWSRLPDLRRLSMHPYRGLPPRY
jgi:hypothetical protein